jgi:hypothetical protein
MDCFVVVKTRIFLYPIRLIGGMALGELAKELWEAGRENWGRGIELGGLIMGSLEAARYGLDHAGLLRDIAGDSYHLVAPSSSATYLAVYAGLVALGKGLQLSKKHFTKERMLNIFKYDNIGALAGALVAGAYYLKEKFMEESWVTQNILAPLGDSANALEWYQKLAFEAGQYSSSTYAEVLALSMAAMVSGKLYRHVKGK